MLHGTHSPPGIFAKMRKPSLELTFVFLVLCFSYGVESERGFDYQYRLPRDWLPIIYRLKIFYEESVVTIPAELHLKMMANRPTEKLVLHAFSPSVSIQETKLVKLGGESQNEDLGDPIATLETVKYLLPAKIYRKIDYGTMVEVTFKYTFTVNETSMNGPYRATKFAFNAKDLKENATRIDMFTQMEEMYARRLFPCFDEPEYKAIFYLDRFEFRRKTALKAVVLFNTHGELLSTANNTEIWTFPKPTPKMSPYLIALLVGTYDNFYTYGPLGGSPPKVSFWHNKEANLTEPVEQSRRVIGHFEEYFNVKSPVEKFDFAFVPFEAYGMENWGLIGILRYFKLIGSSSGEEVLVHEIIHQWFGNIITCRWWTDIWINEGLTSFYTGNYMENIFKPTAEMKRSHRKGKMFNEPIRLKKFGGSWAPAYEETPWIMKMLEGVVGKEHFLTAIKNLLTDYHYEPVTSDDFFRVFQRVVDNNGIKGWDSQKNLDVRKFLYNWIFEGGQPTIKAKFNSTSKSFTLSQSHTKGIKWHVPIWLNTTTDDQSSTSLYWLTPKEDLVLNPNVDKAESVEWDPDVIGFYEIEVETV